MLNVRWLVLLKHAFHCFPKTTQALLPRLFLLIRTPPLFKGQLNVMELCLREKQLQGLLVLDIPQDPEYSHLLTFALVPAKEILLSGTTVVPGYNDLKRLVGVSASFTKRWWDRCFQSRSNHSNLYQCLMSPKTPYVHVSAQHNSHVHLLDYANKTLSILLVRN